MTTTYPTHEEILAVLDTPERRAARTATKKAVDTVNELVAAAVIEARAGRPVDTILAAAVAVADEAAPGCHESHEKIVARLFALDLAGAR